MGYLWKKKQCLLKAREPWNIEARAMSENTSLFALYMMHSWICLLFQIHPFWVKTPNLRGNAKTNRTIKVRNPWVGSKLASPPLFLIQTNNWSVKNSLLGSKNQNVCGKTSIKGLNNFYSFGWQSWAVEQITKGRFMPNLVKVWP